MFILKNKQNIRVVTDYSFIKVSSPDKLKTSKWVIIPVNNERRYFFLIHLNDLLSKNRYHQVSSIRINCSLLEQKKIRKKSKFLFNYYFKCEFK